MSIAITPKFEMELSAYLTDESGNYLINEDGDYLTAQGWVDVTADVVISHSPTWTRGNSGRTLFDRVGNIGSYTYALNNSSANANGLTGYYSPDHSNAQSRFGLNTKVRITMTEGATDHEEWQGIISTIEPMAGQYGERKTLITAEDWMANAYRDKIRGITVQSNKRDDEIITTLLALASVQPLATSLSTGDDTYTYALHDENSITSTLARVFQKLMMSGFGRLFLTGYETLTYKSRSDLLLTGTPAATLSDSMSDLKVKRSKSQRVKEILVTTFPVQLDTSASVLWQAQRELTLTTGEEVEFDISFRDPSGRATRVAATSIVTPAATTDYNFSSVSGSGTDLNGSLTISVTLYGDVARVYLKNRSASTGYLWFHQQRGYGAYLYEPVTSFADTGQPDGETLSVEMVYQDDPHVGSDITTLLNYWYVVDVSDVESVTFWANRNQDLTDAAFVATGELVTITETQTGINQNYIINGTSKTMHPGNLLQVTWYLVPANQISGVCRLDVVGLAELDDTAILGA